MVLIDSLLRLPLATVFLMHCLMMLTDSVMTKQQETPESLCRNPFW